MTLIDPRTSIIERRFSEIKNIIVVTSGKGGVGKSMISSTLALILSRSGKRVGLLDLDFTSPSTHVILGVNNLYPEEKNGIVPPLVHNIRYISIVYYAKDKATPFRGIDATNALIELLAITRWGPLDYLLLDLPPGIGDVTLDIIRLLGRARFLIITTPSLLAYETVKKLIGLLQNLHVPIIGVIENMHLETKESIKDKIEKEGVKFLGVVPYDEELDYSLGDVSRLLSTAFSHKLQIISEEALREK